VSGASDFNDAAAQQSMQRAHQLALWMAVIVLPVIGWKAGWPGAAMFVAGAAISVSSLWEWRRLMTTLMARMAVADAGGSVPKVKPMGPVLVGFFLRLGVAVAVLYVSLKYVKGPVIALLAGLAIGVVALTIEALRLLKSWTE